MTYRLSLLLALLSLLAVHSPAASMPNPSGTKPFGGVDPFVGALKQSIPIEVPPFRGLEPGLSLEYSSTAADGWLGVGWQLSGLTFIHRVSPGRGAPWYNDNPAQGPADMFTLDGEELVESTDLGGTHATRRQTFLRIERDLGVDEWIVTQKNGTKATYRALVTTAAGTYSWAVHSVADTRGNQIDFTWQQLDADDWYLTQISYGGASGAAIDFYYELRPDPVRFANGSGLTTTTYRLRTIDVNFASSRARTYQLEYIAHPSSLRSFLNSVTQYGNDATVDSQTGAVTGGSALPSWQLSSIPGPVPAAFTNLPEEDSGKPFNSGDWWTHVDHDGDGREDWKHRDVTSPNIEYSFYFSDGDGTYTSTGTWDSGIVLPPSSCRNSKPCGAGGDIDADGDWDELWFVENGGLVQVHALRSNGDGTFGITTSPLSWTWGTGDYYRAGDLDGDGRADIVRIILNAGFVHLQSALSNGDGTFTEHSDDAFTGWAITSNDLLSLGDANGDGRSDLFQVVIDKGQNQATMRVFMNDGSGVFLESLMNVAQTWLLGDKWGLWDSNGDGRSDLYRVVRVAGEHNFYTFESLGQTLAPPKIFEIQTGQQEHDRIRFADLNGDKRTDILLIRLQSGFTQFRAYLVEGDFTWVAGVQTTSVAFGTDQIWAVKDHDGDGMADVVSVRDGGNAQLSNWVSDSEPDLIERITTPLGGSLGATYASSVTWPNGSLPYRLRLQTVSSVTLDDGRGTPQSTHTKTYEYDGAAWSYSQRRFLGFQLVKEIRDADGNYTETAFVQDDRSFRRPLTISRRDPAGQLYDEIQFQYSDPGPTAPFDSLMTDQWRLECNLDATCKQTLTQFFYDQYGNTTDLWEYGDFGLASDERTTVVGFSPNTTDYIVGLSAYRNVYEGLGASGTLLDQTLFEYDDSGSYLNPPVVGDLTRVRRWDGWNTGYSDTTFDHDAFGNIKTVTDPRLSTTTIIYDTVHSLFPEQVCNHLAQCTGLTWDFPLGLLRITQDPNNAEVETSYNTFGEPKWIEDAFNNRTTIQRKDRGDPINQRIKVLLPDGSADELWSKTYLDGLGRNYRTVREGDTEDLEQTRSFVDSGPRVHEVSHWFRSGSQPDLTSFEYDGAERPTKMTHPDQTLREWVYDDWRVTEKNELGFARTIDRDGDGRPIRVEESTGTETAVVTYKFDLLGNVLFSYDTDLNETSFDWDSLGRKRSGCYPGTGCVTYDYDAGGLLTFQTDARTNQIELRYDELGRVEKKLINGIQSATWTYDEVGHGASIGQLTSIDYSGGNKSIDWELRGLPSQQVDCVDDAPILCAPIAMQWDTLGRAEVLTYPNAEAVIYSYGSSGNLESVAGSITYVSNIDWTPNAQIDLVDYGNGVTTDRSHSSSRLWLNSMHTTNATITLFEATFNRASSGRISSISSSTDPSFDLSTIVYDDLDRLLSVSGGQSLSYSYDIVGNLRTKGGVTYEYNDAQRPYAPTSAGSTNFQYDANGNLKTATTGGAGCNPSTTTFTWDEENRLTKVVGSGLTTDFLYDEAGRRVRKSGLLDSFYFNDFVEYHDDDGTGELVQYYYAGSELVARRDSGGVVWYHGDHLQSIRSVTDSAGQEVGTYEYTPFGEALMPPPSIENEREFGGHITDAETLLVYMGARYHDGSLARFIQPDEIVPNPLRTQSLNRYAYVRNNPLNFVDPTGREEEDATSCNARCSAAVNARLGLDLIIEGLLIERPNTIEELGLLIEFFEEGNLEAGFELHDVLPPNSPFGMKVSEDLQKELAGVFAREPDPTSLGIAYAPDTTGLLGGGSFSALRGLSQGEAELLSRQYAEAVLVGSATSVAVAAVGTGAVAVGAAGGTSLIGTSFGKLGTVVANPGIKLVGFSSAHFVNQAITRGISPQTILNTIRAPTVVLHQAGDRFAFLTNQAMVVLSRSGIGVTVFGSGQFGQPVQQVLRASGSGP